MVEHVPRAAADQELDRPPRPRRGLASVGLANRRGERIAVGAQLVGISPSVGRRTHADLLRILHDLGAIDVADDLVPFAASAARTLTQLCGNARGDVIEVGLGGLEQGDLPFARRLAHLLLFGLGRSARDPVVVGHAVAHDLLDDG